MTPVEYLKHILAEIPDIARQTGYSRFFIARAFTKCYLSQHVQIEEFRTLRLYNHSRPMLKQYLTWRRCKKISDQLNAGATQDDILRFNEKQRFNAFFRDFIHRDWLYIPTSTPEDIAAFLARNDRFLAKACTSTQGKNILLYHSSDVTPEKFLEEYQGKEFLLESLIQQHSALAAVNPDSVNTVRLIAARWNDQVQFVGAGLRSGGSGQFVDNFHHGGTAYPLDLETGIVTGPGIDLQGNPVLKHPVTGHVMPGFQVPHWDMLVEQVKKAAVLAPHIGYVGWDLAVTEDGIEFIEGNINYPGNNIIQLDGPGAYPRLQQFMAQIGLHH